MGRAKSAPSAAVPPGVSLNPLTTMVLEFAPANTAAIIAGKTVSVATGTQRLYTQLLGCFLAVESRKHGAQHIQQSLLDKVGKYSSS